MKKYFLATFAILCCFFAASLLTSCSPFEKEGYIQVQLEKQNGSSFSVSPATARSAFSADGATLKAWLSGDISEEKESSFSGNVAEVVFSSIPIGSKVSVGVKILCADGSSWSGKSGEFTVRSGSNIAAVMLFEDDTTTENETAASYYISGDYSSDGTTTVSAIKLDGYRWISISNQNLPSFLTKGDDSSTGTAWYMDDSTGTWVKTVTTDSGDNIYTTESIFSAADVYIESLIENTALVTQLETLEKTYGTVASGFVTDTAVNDIVCKKYDYSALENYLATLSTGAVVESSDTACVYISNGLIIAMSSYDENLNEVFSWKVSSIDPAPSWEKYNITLPE
jgi:hypothetical protein